MVVLLAGPIFPDRVPARSGPGLSNGWRAGQGLCPGPGRLAGRELRLVGDPNPGRGGVKRSGQDQDPTDGGRETNQDGILDSRELVPGLELARTGQPR